MLAFRCFKSRCLTEISYMALVALPCDLPWWGQLETHIKAVATCQSIDDLIRQMQIIYDLCDVSLDPDDEPVGAESNIFAGLRAFLRDDFSDSDREHFFAATLPTIAESALNLKKLKPQNGLRFSLQQEESEIRLNRDLAGSLIAHAFFSTFPKRTDKTHPTLQDFNFGKFYKHLHQTYQKSKLKSLFRYFELRKRNHFPSSDAIVVSRQMMKRDECLTLEDWIRCDLPLCFFAIRHENRMENAGSASSTFVCFSSRKPGGRVLEDGGSLECLRFATCPELLVTLLNVEALDDNEALIVENLVRATDIQDGVVVADLDSEWEVDSRSRPMQLLNICLMDARSYRNAPAAQYEEMALLRELNKAAIAFYPPQSHQPLTALRQSLSDRGCRLKSLSRRLSPIGESASATPIESNNDRFHSHPKRDSDGKKGKRGDAVLKTVERFATAEEWWPEEGLPLDHRRLTAPNLGPASEKTDAEDDGAFESCRTSPAHSPCTSSSKNFHSAACSFSDAEYSEAEDENVPAARRYSGQLDTVERRNSFAERLRAALRRARSVRCSGDSNYAVDISVAGSSIADPNIRMKRGGSTGFMLDDHSSNDGDFTDRRRRGEARFNAGPDSRVDESGDDVPPGIRSVRADLDGNSSEYSFSADCSSSDLADVCDRLNRWLYGFDADDGEDGYLLQQKLREDDAISRFARNLLKRALSESFVGVELTDGDRRTSEAFADDADADAYVQADGAGRELTTRRSTCFKKNESKLKMAARSLSLELVKRKQRLASKAAVSRWSEEAAGERRASTTIVTGNWGCGSSALGDAQLKLLIQWLAASVAGVSRIVYYTRHHRKLSKLDTLRRILVDRGWKVGDLLRTIIHHTRRTIAESKPKAKDAAAAGGKDSLGKANADDTDTDSDADGNERIGDAVTLFDFLIGSNEKVADLQSDGRR